MKIYIKFLINLFNISFFKVFSIFFIVILLTNILEQIDFFKKVVPILDKDYVQSGFGLDTLWGLMLNHQDISKSNPNSVNDKGLSQIIE